MDPAADCVETFDPKRLFDLVGACLGLVVLSPLIALISLATRLGLRGPILLCQERSGHNGKPFRVDKFRTIIPSLVALPNREAVANDPRITGIGHFLCRQLLNEFCRRRLGLISNQRPSFVCRSKALLSIGQVACHAQRDDSDDGRPPSGL